MRIELPTTSRYIVIYLHLALGLLIIPFGLGTFDMTDATVRLPAILIVGVDAATAFQLALTYTGRIWPCRDLMGDRFGNALFHPAFTWLAAVGYYLTCLWLVMAILARPDAPVNWGIAVFFLAGFGFVAFYKVAMVRMSAIIAERLAEGLDE